MQPKRMICIYANQIPAVIARLMHLCVSEYYSVSGVTRQGMVNDVYLITVVHLVGKSRGAIAFLLVKITVGKVRNLYRLS